MTLFLIIYLLGVVATMLFLYCSLEHGLRVTIGDIVIALVISGFSWLAFVTGLIIFFADYVVFIKK